MRIAVTGCAGFIGSHLCERLTTEGSEVSGIDNFDGFYDRETKLRNLSNLEARPNWRFEVGDIRDADAVGRLLKRSDILVHLAARAGVRPSFEHIALYADVNVNGTARLLEGCLRNSIDRLVFISSSSVYGANKQLPFDETQATSTPLSPYASTKIAGEMLCKNLAAKFAHLTVLRLFTVYGPRQRPDLAIHKFATKISKGEPIPMFGNGQTFRDYTFIEDIVNGIVAATQSDDRFMIANLASGRPIKLTDMIAELEVALDTKAVVNKLPMQRGDVGGTWGDISVARQRLDYEPSWSFSDGVRAFIDWFKQKR